MITVPADAVPNGIPFDELAVVESLGRGYVEPVHIALGWQGGVGPRLPDPLPTEEALHGTSIGFVIPSVSWVTTGSPRPPSTRTATNRAPASGTVRSSSPGAASGMSIGTSVPA